jgi:DNA adenine methylase
MKYMGSKNRFAKELLPIILKDRTKGQYYVEPFAGGMNLIDKVTGNRIANDIQTDLIEMWKALVYDLWKPPFNVSENRYNKVKNEKQNYPKKEVAYIGFNSYGGKYFRGFRRDNTGKRDYWKEHYNNIMKQVPKLNGVEFKNCSFPDLDIPKDSIIYCDPPYFGTEQYKNKFNHILFWDWVRTKSKQGNKVYVSKYNAPSDFVCVWEKKHKTIMANGEVTKSKDSTERLFIYCG